MPSPQRSDARRHFAFLLASVLVATAACAGPEEEDETESVASEAFSSTLPSQWITSAVGTNGTTGKANYDSLAKTFRTEGAGSRIGSTSDAFFFVHRPHSGEGEIVARVTGFTGSNDNARHGIMVRASRA
jgi:hypothetical protein